MSALRAWFVRLGGLFGKEQQDRKLAEELESHVQMHIDDNLRAGMGPEEARRDALIKLGGIEQTKETYRDRRGLPWLESLLQDVRFGLRMLRKNPGFTAVAILTLALGIGANAAIYSVIDGALLNPIPFPHPDRIVDIHARWPQFQKAMLSYPNFLDIQRENATFESIAVWRTESFTRTGLGDPERLQGKMVSANFFSLLGIRPLLGRTFRAEEDQLGAAPVVLIGEGLWKRRFGADPEISGKSITLDGKDYTVIGVVPSDVHLLRFRGSFFDDVFLPVGQWDNGLLRDRRNSLGLRTVGRIKNGVTFLQAQAEMDRFGKSLAAAYPGVNDGLSVWIEPLKDDLVGNIRPSLLMLWGAVGFVLLIACANVANLLLARSSGRTQEFAIRAALGAGRARIVRQLLVESILLVLAGGAVGVGLASWGTRGLLSILPSALPAVARVGINWRVLLFALGVSAVAGILFGMVPALRFSKTNLQEALRESGRGNTGAHHRIQGALVAAEFGLALVLLIAAGLLIRSLEKVWAVNPGFDPENLLTFSVSFSPGIMSSPERTHAALHGVVDSVAAIPGVQAASVDLGVLPFEGDSETVFWPDEKPKPARTNELPLTLTYFVGADYFQTMRIPLLRGRAFTPADDLTASPVLVVDEDLANSIFPGEDPIGKRLHFGTGPSQEIVGVVGHVRQWGLGTDPKGAVHYQTYWSFKQLAGPLLPILASTTYVVVRSARSPASLVDPIRRGIHAIDGNAPLYDVRTMREIMAASLAERRFSMVLLGVFAAIALLLAAIGIYGVVSYLAAQRTHEIGIRMALGARPGDVLRMVLSQGGRMALVGIAVGLAASLALTRLMVTMLFGVSATDPVTFAGVVVFLLGVVLLACWIPARRATRVDPMVALRYE
ncbi:MAG: ABC transporter permease [Acidobacteriia bacterium]|nr:ABC transporter permease [Terriglobia bacterium]